MPNIQERLDFSRELVVAGRHWRTRLDERLKPFGMSHARWTALYWLSEAKVGVSQTDLAELAGIESPALVRTIDLLEKEGLVKRCPSPTDRRVNLLHLTEAARATVAKVESLADELRREVLAGIPADDVRKAMQVLKQVRLRLDSAGHAPSTKAAALTAEV